MIAHILAEAASAKPGGTDSGLIVALLGAGGFGAVIAAIVTGLFSKRKLGAEATKIITDAAAGVVTSIEAELERARQTITTERAEHNRQLANMAQAHVRERNEWRKVLQLHVAWDSMAIAKFADMEITMPPVPPVTPAQRFVDDQGYPIGGVDSSA